MYALVLIQKKVCPWYFSKNSGLRYCFSTWACMYNLQFNSDRCRSICAVFVLTNNIISREFQIQKEMMFFKRMNGNNNQLKKISKQYQFKKGKKRILSTSTCVGCKWSCLNLQLYLHREDVVQKETCTTQTDLNLVG